MRAFIFANTFGWVAVMGLMCVAVQTGRGSGAAVPCIAEPCVFSTNVPYDAEGQPDTRPGTWGSTAYNDLPIPFVGVPAGYRVRVLRVYGDFVAWAHGKIPHGTAAGTLFGLTSTSGGQSPFVGAGLGSKGCFLYLQAGVGADPVRAAFDFNVAVGGLLEADHMMLVRRAVWLNATGVSIHMEPSFVVEFRYEPVN